MQTYSLEPVDRIDILTLADNYIDLLLQGDARVQRPPLARSGLIPDDTLLAEHGLSLMVTLQAAGTPHTVLMDAGYSAVAVPHNMEMLGIDPDSLDAVVLSHGHMDHTGALYPLLDTMKRRIPLVVHPDAFLEKRYLELPDGRRLRFPQTLGRPELEKRPVDVQERKEPTLICGHHVLVTGEVERRTAFEKGLPGALAERDGSIVPDPILDDQALVLHLKGRGLVVISGCSHAGIVNTVLYARKLTGVEQIHAVLGGFHLTGLFFEEIIPQTIEAFKAWGCSVVVPMHCTGWKAIEDFKTAFPEAFRLNAVGTRITLD